MVKAVVFDWGGVLAGNVENAATELEKRLGLPAGSMPSLLGIHPYETDLDNQWHRRELGLSSLADWAAWFADRVRAAGGPTLQPELIAASETQRFTMTPNKIVHDALLQLRDQDVILAICTNNFAEIDEVWRRSASVDLFDAVFVSCELGMRKPDREIFDHVSAELCIEPRHIVLLDDLPANVEGARRAGWRAILVDPDPTRALTELTEMILPANHGSRPIPTS